MDAILTIGGLALNLLGVVLLFLYGMPFHVPQNGAIYLALEQEDEESRAREERYKGYGAVGLMGIIIGTCLQAAAVTIPYWP